jgi:RHS repeat-associated protein
MVIDITMWNTGTGTPSRVYDLVVGKLPQVLATYGLRDYVPYVHSDYKFGYNGMEIDPEMKGAGNSYTTEFRQYDPRLGRWASLDPLMMEFPEQSPYVAFDNNPVVFTDPFGLAAEGDPIQAALQAASRGIAMAKKLVEHAIELEEFTCMPDASQAGSIGNGQLSQRGWSPSPLNVPSSIKPTSSSSPNGQCFPNAPTLGGQSHTVASEYKVIPGTTVQFYRKNDGTTLNQNAGNYVLIGGTGAKGNLLGLLIVGGIALNGARKYSLVTIEQIEKIDCDDIFEKTTPDEIRVNPDDFMDDDDSVQEEKMGRQHGNTPRNNGDQNKQVRDLVVKYKLTKALQRKLHDLISKKGYGYKEIEELIKDPANGLIP